MDTHSISLLRLVRSLLVAVVLGPGLGPAYAQAPASAEGKPPRAAPEGRWQTKWGVSPALAPDAVRMSYRLHEIEGELAALQRVAERQQRDLAVLQQQLAPVPGWHWTDGWSAAALLGLLGWGWVRRRAARKRIARSTAAHEFHHA